MHLVGLLGPHLRGGGEQGMGAELTNLVNPRYKPRSLAHRPRPTPGLSIQGRCKLGLMVARAAHIVGVDTGQSIAADSTQPHCKTTRRAGGIRGGYRLGEELLVGQRCPV